MNPGIKSTEKNNDGITANCSVRLFCSVPMQGLSHWAIY